MRPPTRSRPRAASRWRSNSFRDRPTETRVLFSRRRSSLNLFLILPVLILFAVGCLCSGGRNDPQTCITSDGSNLVWAGLTFQIVKLADGTVTSAEPGRYADVLCAADNEIMTVKEESVRKNNESRTVRTMDWRNAAKTYQLADIESFQKFIGFIQIIVM